MKIPKLSLPTNLKISLPHLKKSNDGSDQIGTLSPEAIRDAKRTKLIRCTIVVLTAVLGVLIINDHNSSKTANKLPSVNLEAQKNNGVDVNDKNTSNIQKKGKLTVNTDIAAVNPFIFDAAEDTIMTSGTDGSIQQNGVHRVATAAADLPVIPGYQPRPNLPQIPNKSYEASPQRPQEHAKVQGVFVGGKSSMAIMSDGTVVSEGEYYKDSRISWIGGDGIHFDNGESIRYR